MSVLSERIQKIQPSATLRLSAQAAELKRQGRDIISLTAGEPDFDTPEFIKAAAIKAMQEGDTKYTAVDGTPALKTAIQTKLKRENQLDYSHAEIIVSNGAKHSIFNLYAVLLNPGDEVIIPAPYWVSYPDMARLFDAIPVFVTGPIQNRYKILPEDLEAAITPKTKLLILNSPSNPTGMAYTDAELKAIGNVLRKHPHVFVISDDIYERILWSKEPFSNLVMSCPDLKNRVFIVNGVSKAYAMTGWRIGFTAGPAEIIAAMKKYQSQSTSNPCSIAQAAAAMGFAGDQSSVDAMCAAYKARHDYFLPALNEIGFKCAPCDGAFYAFPDVTALMQKTGIQNDTDFSSFLLEKAEVATIPG
ncbi:MAG: pyridoxal phosphate-dependent aminotransferase, partial [Gammaproteobacteria bacterium]|nr:pyridoxal phosphate-dependent aminotransferase [Gammaproteobacteria bacterium]